MSVLASAKALSLALLGTAVAAGAAISIVNAASSAKADFGLAISPASKTVAQGQTASYTVTESVNNGFKDGVALTTSNLPAGASAIFSPNVVSKPSNPASLAISVAASTTVGTYSDITVTGTSGDLVHSYTIQLVVTAASSAGYTLSVAPNSVSVLPGDPASYTVTLARTTYAGAVALSVTSGLPASSTATFTPASTTGNTSSLVVTTKNNTPTGIYTVVLAGTAAGKPQQSASVTLVVSGIGKDFTMSAPSPSALVPGSSQPINLGISNVNKQPLSVTSLNVVVSSVTPAAGFPAGGCTPGDFAVVQYSGSYPITVPGPGTVTMLGLGLDPALWPHVVMLDRSTNQNACVGASYFLSFSGAGHG